MSALLVLVGVSAVGGGGALALGRRTLVAGLGVQAGGCAVLGTGGLWALVAGLAISLELGWRPWRRD